MSQRLHDMTPFEKGVDFITFFNGKTFTLHDIQERYQLCYRSAVRLRNQVGRIVDLKPAGFQPTPSGMAPQFLWEISNND